MTESWWLDDFDSWYYDEDDNPYRGNRGQLFHLYLGDVDDTVDAIVLLESACGLMLPKNQVFTKHFNYIWTHKNACKECGLIFHIHTM